MGSARLIVAALLLLLTLVGGGSHAIAHAVLIETRPAADAVLDEPPEAVVLTFNEAVRPVFVRVLDANGAEVEGAGPVRAVDRRVEVPLTERSPGGYIVSWRVVSADSHPIGGSFRFAIGDASPAWDEAAVPDDLSEREFAWRIAFVLNRAIFLVSLLSAAGGVWFLALVARHEAPLAPSFRRWTASWAAAATLTGAWLVPLQGALMLTPGPGGLIDPAVWSAGLQTGMGRSAVVAAVAMAVVAAGAVFAAGRAGLAALSVVALVGAASLALAGHAATAEPRALAAPAMALHAVAVALWLGSLWPLLVAVRHLPPETAGELIVRFSRAAMVAVAVLVAAGLTLAIVQVGDVAALATTTYGRLLVAKVGLVALALLLAAANKWRHTAALGRGEVTARARLDRNIRLEAGALMAAVTLVAAMGQSVPPRALHDRLHHAPHHAHDHIHDVPDHPHRHEHHEAISAEAVDRLGRRARLRVTPGRPGHNVIEAEIHTADGALLTPLEARVRFAQPDRGIEPLTRQMEVGEGVARYDGSDMSLPGRWIVRIEALVTDFDRAIFETEVVFHQ